MATAASTAQASQTFKRFKRLNRPTFQRFNCGLPPILTFPQRCVIVIVLIFCLIACSSRCHFLPDDGEGIYFPTAGSQYLLFSGFLDIGRARAPSSASKDGVPTSSSSVGFIWLTLLLLLAGDVELNPGPASPASPAASLDLPPPALLSSAGRGGPALAAIGLVSGLLAPLVCFGGGLLADLQYLPVCCGGTVEVIAGLSAYPGVGSSREDFAPAAVVARLQPGSVAGRPALPYGPVGLRSGSGLLSTTFASSTATELRSISWLPEWSGGNRSTRRKPTQTRGEHTSSAQRGPPANRDLNPGPPRCEAAVLPTAPSMPRKHILHYFFSQSITLRS
ncbi:uncharacterized protein LOC133141602 [Conger conger]|uniref:uncharacterized protein LOC133141602 n=1 Tax=Conger conger TaxID=82655 RepID=UPI002A5A31D9|nr:uncharacterized protein LOC133141602 [Conger conger]